MSGNSGRSGISGSSEVLVDVWEGCEVALRSVEGMEEKREKRWGRSENEQGTRVWGVKGSPPGKVQPPEASVSLSFSCIRQ